MEASSEITERVNPATEFPLISHGLPFPSACFRHMTSTLHCSRAYIIISATIASKTTAISRLESTLGARVVGVRKGMQPHTYYSEVLQIAQEVRDKKADCLITIGGGSLVDAAKAISFLLANEKVALEDVDAVDAFFKKSMVLRVARAKDPAADAGEIQPSKIPIICVPTTLSSGEYNPVGGATNDASKHKQLFYEPERKAPKVLIWDPELCLDVPARIWLSTGLRAVDHCTETICSENTKVEGTEWSVKGLKLVLPALLKWKKLKKQGDSGEEMKEAILGCFKGGRCSMMASQLYGVHVGGSHGIGHQLGPYGVPHAETTCVILPAVQRFNASVNGNTQSTVCEVLWGEPAIAEVLERRGLNKGEASLGDCLDKLIRELGFARCLKQYGVKEGDLEKIAVSSLGDMCSKWNVISLVKKEQVMEILEASIEDSEAGYVPEFR